MNQARTLLAPVYRRFTEGFETADLIAANAPRIRDQCHGTATGVAKNGRTAAFSLRCSHIPIGQPSEAAEVPR